MTNINTVKNSSLFVHALQPEHQPRPWGPISHHPLQVNDLNNGKVQQTATTIHSVYARGCLASKLDAGIYSIV